MKHDVAGLEVELTTGVNLSYVTPPGSRAPEFITWERLIALFGPPALRMFMMKIAMHNWEVFYGEVLVEDIDFNLEIQRFIEALSFQAKELGRV